MTPAIANHLLQSTIFAVAAGLLTLLLRNNHARTRYWIWLAASIKFLIPFQIFIELGHRISWSKAPVIAHQPTIAIAIDTIAEPFAPAEFSGAAITHSRASAIHSPHASPRHLDRWHPLALLIFWLIRWHPRHRHTADTRRPLRAGRIRHLPAPSSISPQTSPNTSTKRSSTQSSLTNTATSATATTSPRPFTVWSKQFSGFIP